MTKPLLTVILPTYNESGNIGRIVAQIIENLDGLGDFEILFIDDSTDETPDLIGVEAERDSRIRMVHRPVAARNGLAGAFVDGFKHARGVYICCMDADLQHPPSTIPILLNTIQSGDADLVVASRYIKGGSADGLGTIYRRTVSLVAKYIAKILLSSVPLGSDPGSGFFILKRTLIKNAEFSPRGFKTLIEVIVKTRPQKILEIPVHFLPREKNVSKATVAQGIAFLQHISILSAWISKNKVVTRDHSPWKIWNVIFNRIFFGFLFCVCILGILAIFALDKYMGWQLLDYFVPIFAIAVSLQGMFALWLMLYAWEDPARVGEDASPKTYLQPQISFTAIIPARHEEKVIGDTIRAVAAIDYPEILKEILIVCREDDKETIASAKKAISALDATKNVKLVIFDGYPINKPHGLKVGLQSASNEVIVVFDAEDEPHADIFKVVNTVMIRDQADVVQSGVQLMNYRSRWFSMFNVIEYYFWFKSTLHFFAKSNLIPLGGNTIFFKRTWLEKVDDWDERCLTEDADIGIRLSLEGANIRVVYDEAHVTKEETPDTVFGLIKQRTRWNQGFLQILFKRDWMRLPKLSQRSLAVYILMWPIVQAVMFLYVPIAIWMIFAIKLPTTVALLALLPLYIISLHFIVYLIGLYEFTRDYKLRFPFWLPVQAVIFYYPFQFIIGFSAFRAIARNMAGSVAWEKTEHLNLHRERSTTAPLTQTTI